MASSSQRCEGEGRLEEVGGLEIQSRCGDFRSAAYSDALMKLLDCILSGFIDKTSRFISNHSNLKLMLHDVSQTCWSQVLTGGLFSCL